MEQLKSVENIQPELIISLKGTRGRRCRASMSPANRPPEPPDSQNGLLANQNHLWCSWYVWQAPQLCRGREPPDAISHRYSDTRLSDLLGRLSLRYAEMSMRNTSKCTCLIKEGFWTCVFSLNKRFFFQIFQHCGMRGFSKMRSIYQLS